MRSLRGRLLLAGPGLLDPNFFRSVILLLEHTDEGALGLVLNRPTDRNVDVEPVVGAFGMVDLDEDPDEWRDVRLFSGYSGWGPGQLESEIDEDAWLVLESRPEDVATNDAERLWSKVLARQPGRLSLLARYPDEPAFN
jgi:putative transcriptional regulator